MFIIAEVGSNWRTKADCIRSIYEAREAGADAVKFQAFTARDLYGFVPFGWDYCRELPIGWIPELKEHSDKASIEFMCTAFSPTLVELINPFVSRHKVASSDCSWSPMLEAVWQTEKPILLSTGAATIDEIDKSLFELVDRDVTLMYCEASYPAKWHDLRLIKFMQDRWPEVAIGYSDHTIDIINAPVQARDYGATVLEKHFTIMPHENTPDRGHSLDPGEFKAMVLELNDGRPPSITPTHGWREMREYHKRGTDGFRRVKG